MKTAERATLHSLTAELVTEESRLSGAQTAVQVAMTRRDFAQRKLDQFLESIPVSDAPAEVKPKRAYNRKSTFDMRAILDEKRNAALSPTETIGKGIAEKLNAGAALSGTQGEK